MEWDGWRRTTARLGMGVVPALLLTSTAWAAGTPSLRQAAAVATASWLDRVPSGAWGVLGAAVGALIAAVVNWRGQRRQVEQFRQTLEHQAEQFRQTLAHQERQLKATQQYQAEQQERLIVHQVQQETLRDARSLRDRRYEREVATLEAVVFPAWALLRAVKETGMPLAGETVEEHDARLKKFLASAFIEVGKAQVRLSLDEETVEMADMFATAYSAFLVYQDHDRQLAGTPNHTEAGRALRQGLAEQKRKELRRLKEAVDQLEATARARLGRLRQPIPPPSDEPPD